MNEKEFKKRTRAIALRVIRLVESLPKTRTAEVIGWQLLRSGTSIGANYRAACRGVSRADVISKLGDVEEEADESLYWMELLIDAGIVTEPKLRNLMNEVSEIVAMIVASIRTMRTRNPKSKIQNPKSKMRTSDFIRLTLGSLRSQRLRTLLAELGIAVGIASVILLTSIGEGLRQYVLAQFSQFGTNLIIVTPGRVQTAGMSIGVFGTVRPLTIDDAIAVRRAPYVLITNPAIDGNAEIAANGRRRRITVYGFGPDWLQVGHMSMRIGSFLPRDDLHAPRSLAVLGSRAKQELFGDDNPLGKRVEIGGYRFQVIGVMESKGQFLGMDLDDTVFIPVARAQVLFNRDSLVGFHVNYDPEAPVDKVVDGIRRIITSRHGRDDISVVTQDQMIKVLGSVLAVLSFAVGALGGISLLVGGVGILTIMTITVTERTSEIGLLRAIGGSREQVLGLFLGEAAMLAAVGGTTGLILGVVVARLLALMVPALPVSTPWWFAILAEGMAVTVGLVAGVLPARQAARMEPVDALRSE